MSLCVNVSVSLFVFSVILATVYLLVQAVPASFNKVLRSTLGAMNNDTCDWCLQNAAAQTIENKLWHFQNTISAENSIAAFQKKICTCQTQAFIVDQVLPDTHIKDEPDEPSIDIEYHHLSHDKEDVLEEDQSCHSTNSQMKSRKLGSQEVPSFRNVKEEPVIDIDNRVIKDDICLFSRASDKKANAGLELKVVLEKLIHADVVSSQMKPASEPVFSCSFLLKRHKRIHTGYKSFRCSYCNKCFTDSSTLNKHKRIHTGEKPFKCSYCNKAFAQSAQLKNHERIHTGEKPFKCSYCNKAFTESGHLKNHIRIHTGDKPFKCSHCHKAYAHSGTLKKHKCIC